MGIDGHDSNEPQNNTCQILQLDRPRPKRCDRAGGAERQIAAGQYGARHFVRLYLHLCGHTALPTSRPRCYATSLAGGTCATVVPARDRTRPYHAMGEDWVRVAHRRARTPHTTTPMRSTGPCYECCSPPPPTRGDVNSAVSMTLILCGDLN